MSTTENIAEKLSYSENRISTNVPLFENFSSQKLLKEKLEKYVNELVSVNIASFEDYSPDKNPEGPTLKGSDEALERKRQFTLGLINNINSHKEFPLHEEFGFSSAGTEIYRYIKSQEGKDNDNILFITGNAAPGIGSTNNLHREEFFGTSLIDPNGKVIIISATNSSYDGYDHFLGALTKLEDEGYKISKALVLNDDKTLESLKIHGQFRSKYMGQQIFNSIANGLGEIQSDGVDLWSTIKEQHSKVDKEFYTKTDQKSELIIEKYLNESFSPFKNGNNDSYITIISTPDNFENKLAINQEKHGGGSIDLWSLNDGVKQTSFKQNLDAAAFKLFSTLEFEGIKNRVVVIDDEAFGELSYKSQPLLNVKLNNGVTIVTRTPEVLAGVAKQISEIEGDNISKDEVIIKATEYRKTISLGQSDGYGNQKTFLSQKQFNKTLEKLLDKDLAGSTKDNEIVRVSYGITYPDGSESVREAFFSPEGSFSSKVPPGVTKFSVGSTPSDDGSRIIELFTNKYHTVGDEAVFKPGTNGIKIYSAEIFDLTQNLGNDIDGKPIIQNIFNVEHTAAMPLTVGYDITKNSGKAEKTAHPSMLVEEHKNLPEGFIAAPVAKRNLDVAPVFGAELTNLYTNALTNIRELLKVNKLKSIDGVQIRGN